MRAGVPVVHVRTPAKPWWRSRTLWVNAAVLLLAAAEAHLGVLQPLLGLDVYAMLAFALPLANALLRALTVQPVSWRPPHDRPMPQAPEEADPVQPRDYPAPPPVRPPWYTP